MHADVVERMALQGRPAPGRRRRRVRAALPADRRPRHRRGRRRRGARPVEPPRARSRLAGGLHPAGRGDRAHHPDRLERPAHGLRRRGALARRARRRVRRGRCRSTSPPARSRTGARRRRGGCAARRGLPGTCLTLEITESVLLEEHDVVDRDAVDAQGPRRPDRPRRLRHRLLVAQLPRPVPRRRREDRPVVRGGHRRRRNRLAARARHRQPGRGPRPRRDRRGHRDASTSWTDCGSWAARRARASSSPSPWTPSPSPGGSCEQLSSPSPSTSQRTTLSAAEA